jgi:hypothetical protein
VELEEESHEYCDETVEDVTQLDKKIFEQNLLILRCFGQVVSVDFPPDAHEKVVT